MKKFTLLFLALLLVACQSSTASKDYSNAKSISDLTGFKFAAQSGTNYAVLPSQVEDSSLKEYPTIDDSVIALKNNVVEGIVLEETTALAYVAKDSSLSILKFEEGKGFEVPSAMRANSIGFKKGSEYKDQVNKVLAKLDKDTRQALIEQMIRFRNTENFSEELVFKPTAAKNPTGVLKVGIECASEPYNWSDTVKNEEFGYPLSNQGQENLYAYGYDVIVAQYIASELNLKLELYQVNWESLIPAVNTGTIDFIISNMSPTDERKQSIDFSDSYLDVNIVILTKK